MNHALFLSDDQVFIAGRRIGKTTTTKAIFKAACHLAMTPLTPQWEPTDHQVEDQWWCGVPFRPRVLTTTIRAWMSDNPLVRLHPRLTCTVLRLLPRIGIAKSIRDRMHYYLPQWLTYSARGGITTD